MNTTNSIVIFNGQSDYYIFTNGYYEHIEYLDKITHIPGQKNQTGLISIYDTQLNLTHIK